MHFISLRISLYWYTSGSGTGDLSGLIIYKYHAPRTNSIQGLSNAALSLYPLRIYATPSHTLLYLTHTSKKCNHDYYDHCIIPR